jgi:hypothetical protein
MSEYIEIDAELGDEGMILFHTNLNLTVEGRTERYAAAELEEGSPVAQALAAVDGIKTLEISGGELIVVGRPDADWHVLIADVSAVLKDFFL